MRVSNARVTGVVSTPCASSASRDMRMNDAIFSEENFCVFPVGATVIEVTLCITHMDKPLSPRFLQDKPMGRSVANEVEKLSN